jgi:hypothetical protein
MSEFTENYHMLTDTRITGPAEVLRVDASGSYAYLRVKRDFEYTETRARIAIPTPCKLSCGDSVLVMAEDPDHAYIIGILDQEKRQVNPSEKIELDNGTHVTRDNQSLKVLSHKKELIFEYDEKTGKSTVNLESGDMDFVSRRGNINFVAGKDIMLNGRTVGITSQNGMVMGMVDKLGKLISALTIKNAGIHMNSQELGIEAKHGKFEIGNTELKGEKLEADLTTSKLKIGRLETMAKTIITKTKNIYKTVEELSQVKTGRMRTIVENTFHLKSRKAMLKSDDDFKVRAEKIHLG